MILDSSALVAILHDETEADDFMAAIHEAGRVAISGATVLETSMVVGQTRWGDLDDLLKTAHAELLPLDRAHVLAAREAFVRYGRGSGSSARLNFGDCLAYAAAKVTGEPLLFKGDDFTHTDIEAAL